MVLLWQPSVKARVPRAAGMPPRKRAADAATDTKETSKKFRSAIDAMADEWVCPITCELPIDPVMAEDGRIYERAAIEEHIRVQGACLRSPFNNVVMGPKLIASVQARNSIERLMKTGAICGDKATQWEQRIADQEWLGERRRCAEEGDVDSMVELGHAYYYGSYGAKKDFAMSFHWYKKAADADDPHGLCNAAYALVKGHGVQQNEAAGMLMMARAAAKGHIYAGRYVARSLEDGVHGLAADPAQARLWRGSPRMGRCGLPRVTLTMGQRSA